MAIKKKKKNVFESKWQIKCGRTKHLACLINIESVESAIDKCYSSYKEIRLFCMQNHLTEPTFHCKIFHVHRLIPHIIFHNIQGLQRKFLALSVDLFYLCYL